MEYNLSFTKNWNNKFNCPVFTTIRPVNPIYKEGDFCNIIIAGNTLLKAKIIYVLDTPRLADLPAAILCIDTGTFSKKEAIELFSRIYDDPDIRNKPFIVLTLIKI